MYSKVMILIDNYCLSNKYFLDSMEINTEETLSIYNKYKIKSGAA